DEPAGADAEPLSLLLEHAANSTSAKIHRVICIVLGITHRRRRMFEAVYTVSLLTRFTLAHTSTTANATSARTCTVMSAGPASRSTMPRITATMCVAGST